MSTKLFRVQDADRPAYVLATDWTQALSKWQQQIIDENPEEDCSDTEPDGIALVADADELIL